MDSLGDSVSRAVADLSVQDASDSAVESHSQSASSAALSDLRAECEQAWNQVKETHQQLSDCRQEACSSASGQTSLGGQQQPLVAILKEKERRLRAEIEVMKEQSPQGLPNSPEVVESVLLESLEKEVTQLKETLSLVESQRQELQTSIQQEQLFKEQLVAVGEKLQEKRDNLERQEEPQDAVEVVAQELEAKINIARQTEQTIMRKMADFVGRHFPVPDPEQVVRSSKELRSKKQLNKETLPLKEILLELMTKCVENPEDPYLTLDERHWPAYVELLLRCNIVLQHPNDDRRVKLVPFHL